jgi:xanthine dehydrogenase YagT iron-sulfur-binding subunit
MSKARFDRWRPEKSPEQATLSRRDFMVESGAASVGSVVAGGAWTSHDARAQELPTHASASTLDLKLVVNGEPRELQIDPRTTLLDLLREKLALTGTKKGCDHGQCGACTVLIEGRRMNACLALAAVHDGQEVVAVEGLARGQSLHPMQTAFVKHDGFQCGYCTPGQICSAVGMLREAAQGSASFVSATVRQTGRMELSDEEIRERMSGNICRCGAYTGIVSAIREVSRSSPKRGA